MWMEIYFGAGATLIEIVAESWERDGLHCLGTYEQPNPYYPFATREEYKYM